MITALGLIKELRQEISDGDWTQDGFVSKRTGHMCLIAKTRHKIGWEVFSEPIPTEGMPIQAYQEATEAMAKAIVRVFPRYQASDNVQTIMDFNDSDSVRRRVVLEVLDAAILDVEEAVLAKA